MIVNINEGGKKKLRDNCFFEQLFYESNFSFSLLA
jgi:hypothetical protein